MVLKIKKELNFQLVIDAMANIFEYIAFYISENGLVYNTNNEFKCKNESIRYKYIS